MSKKGNNIYLNQPISRVGKLYIMLS